MRDWRQSEDDTARRQDVVTSRNVGLDVAEG